MNINEVSKYPFRLIKSVECPICHYEMHQCQCKYGGKSHPDISDNLRVVLDHLYLLTPEQIDHVRMLLQYMQISYSDAKRSEILSQLEISSEQWETGRDNYE